jgi:hypothetical protein
MRISRFARSGLVASWLVAGCSPETRDPPARPADSPDSLATPKSTPSPADSGATEWTIGPGRNGPITAQTSEADLRRRYGAAVDEARIQLGEGETAPGTVLYREDPLRHAEIIWRDTTGRRQPARLILRGDRSRWQVGLGISLGTSLQDLERLNGKPFSLAGFGWDYAGGVIDWKGGVLDSALAGVRLYLDPGPTQSESAPYSQVLGDREYLSSLPAMQQLNPRVAQIFVDFE